MSFDAQEWARRNAVDDGYPGNHALAVPNYVERNGKPKAPPFPPPLLSSELKAGGDGADWLWYGCLARGGITLLSALWKAGKTTMVAHLLRSLERGNPFCGLSTAPAKIVYVSEESESRWAERCNQIGLGDWCRWQIRPFKTKPYPTDWRKFLQHLRGTIADKPTDLIVIDTLAGLWPVRDENDAGQVQECLQPFQELAGSDRAILLVHHLRKGDGQEATGHRGSGALCALPDILLELRRYDAKNPGDRRRELKGYGRWDQTPSELVIELLPDGSGYSACGDRLQAGRKELQGVIADLLPAAPGLTIEQIMSDWPGDSTPRKQRLLDELRAGLDRGDWVRLCTGKKGDPYTYCQRIP
jgi:hypothetical protein